MITELVKSRHQLVKRVPFSLQKVRCAMDFSGAALEFIVGDGTKPTTPRTCAPGRHETESDYTEFLSVLRTDSLQVPHLRRIPVLELVIELDLQGCLRGEPESFTTTETRTLMLTTNKLGPTSPARSMIKVSSSLSSAKIGSWNPLILNEIIQYLLSPRRNFEPEILEFLSLVKTKPNEGGKAGGIRMHRIELQLKFVYSLKIFTGDRGDNRLLLIQLEVLQRGTEDVYLDNESGGTHVNEISIFIKLAIAAQLRLYISFACCKDSLISLGL
ncbi:hypothetical protein K438DRAFT_1782018 [Mycena galopus ATCC 62051]|nr:hypothetical protein K438DRAFT_1782018 [Mycena galopus ATCC 62051]